MPEGLFDAGQAEGVAAGRQDGLQEQLQTNRTVQLLRQQRANPPLIVRADHSAATPILFGDSGANAVPQRISTQLAQLRHRLSLLLPPQLADLLLSLRLAGRLRGTAVLLPREDHNTSQRVIKDYRLECE